MTNFYIYMKDDGVSAYVEILKKMKPSVSVKEELIGNVETSCEEIDEIITTVICKILKANPEYREITIGIIKEDDCVKIDMLPQGTTEILKIAAEFSELLIKNKEVKDE